MVANLIIFDIGDDWSWVVEIWWWRTTTFSASSIDPSSQGYEMRDYDSSLQTPLLAHTSLLVFGRYACSSNNDVWKNHYSTNIVAMKSHLSLWLRTLVSLLKRIGYFIETLRSLSRYRSVPASDSLSLVLFTATFVAWQSIRFSISPC